MKQRLKQMLLGVVGPVVSQPATLVDVQPLGDQFRRLVLQSKAFVASSLGPADKLQLDAGAWQVRTYTPQRVDAGDDRLAILAYLHGHGPGARWAATAKVGDRTHVVGPAATVPISDAPFVLLGDETSLATAHNLKHRDDVHVVLGVAAPDALQPVVQELGLSRVTLVATSRHDRTALARTMAAELAGLAVPQALFTGHAQTIQATQKALKAQGVVLSQSKTKPYWSDHKVGLD